MKTYELLLPECWADYLINGANDGLDDWDLSYLLQLNSCYALSCTDETFFGHYRGLACVLKVFIFARGK